MGKHGRLIDSFLAYTILPGSWRFGSWDTKKKNDGNLPNVLVPRMLVTKSLNSRSTRARD